MKQLNKLFSRQVYLSVFQLGIRRLGNTERMRNCFLLEIFSPPAAGTGETA
jgi:hypothetical protein